MEQLEKLNSAMSNLATDNDRDVAGEARAVNDSFKRTPVIYGCPCSSVVILLFQHMKFVIDLAINRIDTLKSASVVTVLQARMTRCMSTFAIHVSLARVRFIGDIQACTQ